MNFAINMQYPLDKDKKNPVYDGKKHRIFPTSLKKINNLYDGNFYVMKYYDLNFKVSSITLLRKASNGYVKTPIDNYDVLIDFLKKYEKSSDEVFTDVPLPTKDIGLGKSYRVKEIFKENSSKTDDETLDNEGRVAIAFDSLPPNNPEIYERNSYRPKTKTNFLRKKPPENPFDNIKPNNNSIWLMYPFDITKNYPLCDGKMHKIAPITTWRIQVLPGEFFIMQYHDLTMNEKSLALLTKIDEKYYHVPLDKPEILKNFFNKNKNDMDFLTPCNLPNENIFLAETLEAEYLFLNLVNQVLQRPLEKFKRPSFKFKKYVFFNGDDPSQIAGIYSNLGQVVDSNSSDEKIFFRRDADLISLRNSIAQGSINHFNDFEGKIFQLLLDFGSDMREFRSYYFDYNGEILAIQQKVIPGIHEYNITYSKCCDEEMFDVISNSECFTTMNLPGVSIGNIFSKIGTNDSDTTFYDKSLKVLKKSDKKDKYKKI